MNGLLYNVFVNGELVGQVWGALGESCNPRLPYVQFHAVMPLVEETGTKKVFQLQEFTHETQG